MSSLRDCFKRMGRFVTDLVFPPLCVGCEEVLPPGDPACPMLCPVCRTKYEACRTRTRDLLETPRRLVHISLVQYRPGEEPGVAEHLIYRIKHHEEMRVFRFLAKELQPRVKAVWERLYLDPAEAIWVYPPRRPAALRKDGFDQAQRLADTLAALCGGTCLPLIRRTGEKIKEQKRLDAVARARNAAKAYCLADGAEETVKGRVIMLVDDLCTTGATLGACADLLMAAGAHGVIWVTVGQV